MGNVVLWKPASTAILSCYLVHKIFQEAGVPDGKKNKILKLIHINFRIFRVESHITGGFNFNRNSVNLYCTENKIFCLFVVHVGVVNFLPSSGQTFGDGITSSPHLAGINFTGSVE